MFIAKAQRYVRKADKVIINRSTVTKFDWSFLKSESKINYGFKYFKLLIW